MTSRLRRRMSEGISNNRNGNKIHLVVLILAAAVSGYIVLFGFDSAPRLMGRLHPSLVHLPVGILLLATTLAIGSRFRRWKFLGDSLQTILALGVWSSLLAVVTGSLLASDGSYDEAILDRHRWLGSLLALLNLGIYVALATASRSQIQARNGLATLLLCAGALLLLATGHAGGALTHGPTYLTGVLPEPIKSIFGGGSERDEYVDFEEGRVFDALIAPVLEEHCTECHGQSRSRGGLRVDSFDMLLKGGESGQAVAPGKPGASELLRRITLFPQHEEHMPPDGRPPLSIAQTEVIRWWIQTGASLEKSLVEANRAEMPSSVQTVFNRLAPPRDFDSMDNLNAAVSPPDSSAIEKLRSRGVAVRFLSEKGLRLDISYAGFKEAISIEDLEPLRAIAANVFWLDLSELHLPPGSLEIVGELRSLRRLRLERSSITNQGLENLGPLQNLEYLNLYNTSISDDGIPSLARLSALKSLYLWQSSVSQKGAEGLREALPELNINLGSELDFAQ